EDKKSIAVDSETMQVLCNNGYITNAHTVEKTHSIEAHSGTKINKLKLRDFDRLNVIHMTNKDIEDKSTGRCKLTEIVLGKYNRICKLVYTYKDKQYTINIGDISKYDDTRVIDTNTGRQVHLIQRTFRINTDIGDKFKGRRNFTLGQLMGTPMYTLILGFNTDADMVKELLGNKVKITLSESRQTDDTYNDEIEKLMESMKNNVSIINSNTRLEFLYAINTVGKHHKLSCNYYLVKDSNDNTYLLSSDNMITSKLYKNGDFSQLKEVNVAVNWINVTNKYNIDTQEYSIIREIDEDSRRAAFMKLGE
ncbi:MAG: hypothetical protein J6A59_05380, partial [Lachnospiraceae bacterium]|nr:hypothetical protein [Lachnospiraceae bacterium]